MMALKVAYLVERQVDRKVLALFELIDNDQLGAKKEEIVTTSFLDKKL